MAAVLSEKKEYENANNWLTKAKNESPNAEDMTFYCIAAHNYKLLGNTDSALFYCNKLVNEESYHARHDAYSEFVDIYNARKEYDKAYLYALKFKQQNDSIEALMAQENVAKMQAIYKFQHIENENNALKKEIAAQNEKAMKMEAEAKASGAESGNGVPEFVCIQRNGTCSFCRSSKRT